MTRGTSFSASIVALVEERHETQLDAIFLDEGVLVLLAQGDHPRHVDLVEGGEKRRGVLRLHQPLRHPTAQRSHLHHLFFPTRRSRLRMGRRGRSRRGSWCRRLLRGSRSCGHLALYVFFENPATGTAALYIGRFESCFCQSPASGRRDRRIRRRGFFFRGRFGGGLCFRSRSFGRGFRSCLGRGLLPGLQVSDHFPDLGLVAATLQDLAQESGLGRDQLHVDLVGLQAGHRLVLLHPIPFRLQPVGNHHLGDRLTDHRYFQLDSHSRFLQGPSGLDQVCGSKDSTAEVPALERS